VTIQRRDVGEYDVHFPGLATEQPFSDLDQEGVVHARVTGSIGGVCQASATVQDDRRGAVLAFINCFDNFGKPANRPFTVGYTRGGSDLGSLVSVRMDSVPNEGTTPLDQEVTLNGVLQDFSNDPGTRVLFRRSAVGRVRVRDAARWASARSTSQSR
jgi:hypothetical protein